VVRQALSAPRLTIGELAARLELPRETLAAYIGGKRRTPAPVARRLAVVLRQHAAELAALAAELDDVT
jgi:plasmid maintenance system antidote protein VapI